MSRYCVDASACGHFKLGDSEVVSLLDSAEWIGVTSIVLGALWTGFIQGRRPKENEAELREFLANPAVELLPVDHNVARIYAEIVADLLKAGTPIPTNDIWIAALVVQHDLLLCTRDRHFDHLPQIPRSF